jgi:hypothetical protein
MRQKLGSRRFLGFECLEQRRLMAAGLRKPLKVEGYLRLSDAEVGHERLGATVVYHPAGFGLRDNLLGYDWSSEQVLVNTRYHESRLRQLR